jgi:UDP:flavonoid glycosyltransferase YjiC (YdhE family)
VCDEAEFGAMAAAGRAGLPHATVLVTAAGSFVRPEVVGDALAALRAEHGLGPAPDLEMLGRDLVLSPCPPSFRDPAFPLPETARSIRPAVLDDAAAAAPWPFPSRPAVYFTLGTVFNLESGDLFAGVLNGLGDMPVSRARRGARVARCDPRGRRMTERRR